MAEPETGSSSSKLRFKSVHLLREASLGAGPSGTVCKAKCDDLLCAAKILHLTVKDEKLMRQQCELLNALQHPNIVQHLGTWKDPSTDLPVLLMELMDGNLTQFLDKSRTMPLPFHTQVHICHDISMALSFLHSNGIIHRDLSSNNVLMIGDRRAKVTDFGMAKLWDANLQSSHESKRPGCEAYMSPEALSGNYSTKVDSFSFGVLTIQILTSLFPQPSYQFKAAYVSDHTRNETRATEAGRRKGHTDLVPQDHPLLRIALDCINDKEGDRPSSQDLCSKLAGIKETSRYAESKSKSNADKLMDDIDKQILDLQDLSFPSIDGDMFQSVERVKPLDQPAERPDRSMSPPDQPMERPDRSMSPPDQPVEKSAMDSSVSPRDHSPAMDAGQLEALRLQISAMESKELAMKDEMERLRVDLRSTSKQLEEQQSQILSRQQSQEDSQLEKKAQELEKKLKMSQQIVESFMEETGPMELKRLKLEWNKSFKAPRLLSRTNHAIATTDIAVFMIPGGSTEVYSYTVASDAWSKFPNTPVAECGLAIIKRKLTVIGGKKGDHFTSKLLSLVETAGKKEWIVIYPPMSTQRSNPIVIDCPGSLVVAGGERESGYLKIVEVLDIEASVWHTVADLPNPLIFASAAFGGNQLYISGGWVEKMAPTYSIISCSLRSLLKSSQDTGEASSPWNDLTSLPLKGSTCTVVRGRLLTVGGRDIHKPTSAVHIYNPFSDSWEVLTYMAHPRHQCFAAAVGKKLLVIGGWKLNDKQIMCETNTMETATILYP